MHFAISDTHFGHSNVLKYDGRPFSSIDEHDETLIKNWNSVVRPNDEVWHLGDVARTVKLAQAIIPRLNGRIHIVRGNHDDDLWKRQSLFPNVTFHEAHYLRLEGHRIYLLHYACRVWRNSHHGSFHLHGHSHGALPRLGRSMDVGANCIGYTPVPILEAILKLSDEPAIDHHEKDDGVPGEI